MLQPTWHLVSSLLIRVGQLHTHWEPHNLPKQAMAMRCCVQTLQVISCRYLFATTRVMLDTISYASMTLGRTPFQTRTIAKKHFRL